MFPIWLFLPGLVAFSNDQAWYSSSSKSILTHPDPAVFMAKTAIDLCTLPPDLGGCTKELVRYYYDPVADDCKRFLFTGCGGNSNRFMRRTHCRSRCVKNRLKLQSIHEPAQDMKTAADHKDVKHRRTLTTTPAPTTTTTEAELTTQAVPVTPETQLIQKVPIPAAIKQCPHCDPLFGVCVEGECGCIAGFKKLGRICIDINECDKGETVCPANSRCINTIGSFRCDCDAGFDEHGGCKIEEGACTDHFDIMLTEEDCNHGEQTIRYYYDHETSSCRQFFYGGCKSTSRNIFGDLQTCNTLCMNKNIQPRDPEPTIPLRFTINVEQSTTAKTREEQQEEAVKIVSIMHHMNPNENPCSHPFDEDLREECVLAHWEERFYWNALVRECEPFWYDATCQSQRTAGKNFFETLKGCQTRCEEELPHGSEELHQPVPESTSASVVEFTTMSNPFKLDIETTASTITTSEPYTPSYIQETGNFVSKTASTKFDRQKFMEEFRKKLNALPDNYSKKPFDLGILSTKRPPFTLFPLEDIDKKVDVLDTTLFKEITAIPTTMQTQLPGILSKDSLDLAQFETKRPPLTLNPSIFGEIVDTSQRKEEQQETPEQLTTSATHDPLDLSKFVTKRPPFLIYISGIQEMPKTSATQSILATTGTTTEEPSRDVKATHDPLDLSKFVTRRPPFTLDPAFIADLAEPSTTHQTLSFNKVYEEKDLDRHRYEVYQPTTEERQDAVHVLLESFGISGKLVTEEPSQSDLLISEKQKISNLLDEINKPIDLCDEPLHPTLEEDCSGENWVLQWYFNADRGSCKSFWYGGCPTEARNFFKSHALCSIACAHKIPPADGNFHRQYIIKADTTTTTTTRRPILTATEGPAIERSFKEIKALGGEVFIPIKSGEIDDAKDKKLRYITIPPTTTVTVPFTSTTAITRGDPCDDGYDEQWDSDCSGDNWEVRAYFDRRTNSCKRFWWGGCSTLNRNIWKDKQVCLDACGHKMRQTENTPSEQPAEYGTAEPPSNMIDIFELPTASALVGDRSLYDPDLKPPRRKSRKNRHKLNLKWNVVQTNFEVEKGPSSSLWGVQNDAPVSSSEEEKISYATKEHFEADLQRKLANEKRTYEGRTDIAYSSAVGHPVTIACMFIVSLHCIYAW